MRKKTVAILGAGSWGSAMAIHIAKHGYPVLLWDHTPQQVSKMAADRCNQKYLPDISFPPSLEPVADLNQSVKRADQVIIAVPSHAFASVLHQIESPLKGLSWLTKGVDPKSNKLLSQLVAERYGDQLPIGVISGPSFAKEVARFLPTALTLASNDEKFQTMLHQVLHHGNMRVYLSEDTTGVQICGAVKNVLAIACGISDGLNYGANAKAALITRGLAEMSRLGLQMGAKSDTFSGLAGVGDLVLTCTDDQSRNRRFGLKLGEGISINDAEKQIGQVVEGKHNARQVCEIASEHQIEMPICEQVNALLKGEIDAGQAVINLMNRPAREE